MKRFLDWWGRIYILWRFLFWIFVGGFGFVFLPIWIKGSSCPPKEPTGWNVQAYGYAEGNKNPANKTYHVIIGKEQEKASEYKQHSELTDKKFIAPQFLCEEAKTTDWFLIFFTYCLVVVGWFTMRNVDETAKRTERAYILCGGPFGRRRQETGILGLFDRIFPKIPEKGLRRFYKASDFTGPWRMALHNFGKTSAYIIDVTWGISPYEDFWEYTKVKTVIKNHRTMLPKEAVFEFSKKTDEAIPPDIIGIPYRHVEFPKDRSAYINWVFFGWVRYKDVFGDSHNSYFKLRLTKEHSNPLPGCHSHND